MQNHFVDVTARKRFEEDMAKLCRALSAKLRRPPSSLLRLIKDHGAHGAAIILIQKPHISDVFVLLLERDLLNLSIEALALDYADTDLFQPELLSTCRHRLAEARYSI